MKVLKTLLLSILTLLGITAQAQTVEVYKNGAVIKSYTTAEVDSVVYKPAPTIESSTKILIGDISIGQEIGDALYGDPNGPGEFMTKAQNVSDILTEAIIQQNIDAGNLKDMNLEDALSTYNDWIDRGNYISLYFSSIKKLPIPTHNEFTYHCVLIPTSLSTDYLACWISSLGQGATFDCPDESCASIVDKTLSFNNEEYSMSGYYVDMAGKNANYSLSIVKKNQ